MIKHSNIYIDLKRRVEMDTIQYSGVLNFLQQYNLPRYKLIETNCCSKTMRLHETNLKTRQYY